MNLGLNCITKQKDILCNNQGYITPAQQRCEGGSIIITTTNCRHIKWSKAVLNTSLVHPYKKIYFKLPYHASVMAEEGPVLPLGRHGYQDVFSNPAAQGDFCGCVSLNVLRSNLLGD